MLESRPRLVLLLAAGAVAGASLSAQTPRVPGLLPGETLVGVLRAAGTIIPFASYRDGAWSNDGAEIFDDGNPAWPRAWFVRNGQVAARWTALFAPPPRLTGLTSVVPDTRTVRARDLVAAEAGCVRVWGLTTDAPSRLRSPDYSSGGPVGVAVTGNIAPQRFITLGAASTDRQRLISTLTPLFNRLEDETIARDATRFQKHAPAATRHRLPLVVADTLRTAAPIDGRHFYFVRLTRAYPGTSFTAGDACDDQGEIEAWLTTDAAGRLSVIETAFDISDCDGKGSLSVQPLGTLSLGGRHYVVAIESGYEVQTDLVLELEATRVRRVLATDAGGC